MELGTVTNLIGSLGFPVVICLYMVKKTHDYMDRFLTMIENMNATVDSLSLSIAELNIIVTDIRSKIE